MNFISVFGVLFTLGASLAAGCALLDAPAPKKPSPVGLIATPPAYYSTARARYLGTQYKDNLDRMIERIVRNPKTSHLQFANNISSVGGIGFFTHSATKTSDERYLEVVLGTPETFETKGAHSEKVARLFSLYGQELLATLSGDNDIYQDKELAGYGLNLAWRNVVPEAAGNRVVMERAIAYFPKERVRGFLRREISENDLLGAAVIFAVEEDGPLRLVSYRSEESHTDFRPAIREDTLPAVKPPSKSAPAVKGAAPKTDKFAAKTDLDVTGVKPPTEPAPPAAVKPGVMETPALLKPPRVVEEKSALVTPKTAALPQTVSEAKAKQAAQPVREVLAAEAGNEPSAKTASPVRQLVSPKPIQSFPESLAAEAGKSAAATAKTPSVVSPEPTPQAVTLAKRETVADSPSTRLPPPVSAKPDPGASLAQLEPSVAAPKPEAPPAAVEISAVKLPEEPTVAEPKRHEAVAATAPPPAIAVPPARPLEANPPASLPAAPKAGSRPVAVKPPPLADIPVPAAPIAPLEAKAPRAETPAPAKQVAASSITSVPLSAPARLDLPPPAPQTAAAREPSPLRKTIEDENKAEQIALLPIRPAEALPEIKPLIRPAPRALEGFVVQLAFHDKEKAQRWAESMERRGYAVSITETGAGGALRVRLGNFVQRDEAERQLRNFNQEGLKGIIINLPQSFRPEARSSLP